MIRLFRHLAYEGPRHIWTPQAPAILRHDWPLTDDMRSALVAQWRARRAAPPIILPNPSECTITTPPPPATAAHAPTTGPDPATNPGRGTHTPDDITWAPTTPLGPSGAAPGPVGP